jgi:hypothetical protein
VSSSPLTAEQILERVAERGEDALHTAISLVAIALALLADSDQKTRGELAWFMRKYAAELDGTEGATH